MSAELTPTQRVAFDKAVREFDLPFSIQDLATVARVSEASAKKTVHVLHSDGLLEHVDDHGLRKLWWWVGEERWLGEDS